MPLELSTTEKQKQAAKWFAERFIPDEKAQQFLLLRNGWTNEELGLKPSNLKYRIDRYARYHINFSHYTKGEVTHVDGCQPAAFWANGLIHYEKGVFRYLTSSVPFSPSSSFGISESAPSPAPPSED